MLEKAKIALRVTTNAYDSEINDLISSAVADLNLVGVYTPDVDDPIITRAIITFCRANFGSPGDYDKLKKSYDEQKAQLWSSSSYKKLYSDEVI